MTTIYISIGTIIGIILGITTGSIITSRKIKRKNNNKLHVKIIPYRNGKKVLWKAAIYNGAIQKWYSPYKLTPPYAESPGEALIHTLAKGFQTKQSNILIEYTKQEPEHDTPPWWEKYKEELRSPYSGMDHIRHYDFACDGGYIDSNNKDQNELLEIIVKVKHPHL